MQIVKGRRYRLTFTRPMYLKDEKTYLPDNFRFIDPESMTVAYGGRVYDGPVCRCLICGRPGKSYHEFYDLDGGREVYVSPHCLEHPSTRLWRADVPTKEIEDWYSRRNLLDGAARGDPIAGLALALEEMEAQDL